VGGVGGGTSLVSMRLLPLPLPAVMGQVTCCFRLQQKLRQLSQANASEERLTEEMKLIDLHALESMASSREMKSSS
jgi:hypothetical protein